jgi:hypothetical protein
MHLVQGEARLTQAFGGSMQDGRKALLQPKPYVGRPGRRLAELRAGRGA